MVLRCVVLAVGGPISPLGPGRWDFLPLIGIGLARQPDGVMSQLAPAVRPLWRSPRTLIALVAVLVALTGARAADVLTNWPYALLSVGGAPGRNCSQLVSANGLMFLTWDMIGSDVGI